MHSNMNLMCVATYITTLIYMLHFSAPDCRNREMIKNYHTHTLPLILFSAYINDYNFSIRKFSTLRVGSCVTFIMIKRKTTTIAWRQFFASASAKLFVSLLAYIAIYHKTTDYNRHKVEHE